MNRHEKTTHNLMSISGSSAGKYLPALNEKKEKKKFNSLGGIFPTTNPKRKARRLIKLIFSSY